jgi:hypothetical protein
MLHEQVQQAIEEVVNAAEFEKHKFTMDEMVDEVYYYVSHVHYSETGSNHNGGNRFYGADKIKKLIRKLIFLDDNAINFIK